jgi:hypothetical protein
LGTPGIYIPKPIV